MGRVQTRFTLLELMEAIEEELNMIILDRKMMTEKIKEYNQKFYNLYNQIHKISSYLSTNQEAYFTTSDNKKIIVYRPNVKR